MAKQGKLNSNVVRAVMNKECRHMRIYGGMCLISPDTSGMEGVGLGMPPRQRDIMVNEVVRCLTAYKRDWKLAFYLFYKRDGVEDVYISEMDFTNCTAGDLDEHATTTCSELWAQYDASERISTAWVAIPDTSVDMISEHSTIIDYFSQHKPWDVEYVTNIKSMTGLSASV